MESKTTMWGGRFSAEPDQLFAAFNRSFGFDRRLLDHDLRASAAHANGLRTAGVLSQLEAERITDGLRSIGERARSDEAFLTESSAEDIHSFIESQLIDMIGDTGKKLHTGRSRNDQVTTAFRLWLRDAVDQLVDAIKQLQGSLISIAELHRSAVLPGYTHLQRAQPVLWAHWCLAYYEMLCRDLQRFKEVRRRINVMPLGSGALAGTSFPIDRRAVASELSFEEVSRNSLDAVSDRDFAIEFVGACSMMMMHLSRLAEDLVLYCSSEFGFVSLGDAVSSGSSLMPQKKNPDALELVRGKAGRVFGHHAGLLATMKGLPLAYNKDMQEDKEAVFDSADTSIACLRVAGLILDNLELNEARSMAAAVSGYLNATDLADYLVRKGVPFRSAHDTVGRLVLKGLELEYELNELKLATMQEIEPLIERDVYDALAIDSSLATKSSIGGTSPVRVAEALNAARVFLQ